MEINTVDFFLCLTHIKSREVSIVHVLASAENLCGLHGTVGLLLQFWMDRGCEESD